MYSTLANKVKDLAKRTEDYLKYMVGSVDSDMLDDATCAIMDKSIELTRDALNLYVELAACIDENNRLLKAIAEANGIAVDR